MHPIQQKLLDLAKVRDLSELSIREIGRQIAAGNGEDRVHPQQVKYHLQKLEESGLLKSTRKARAMKTVSQPGNGIEFISIPIVGSADCGPATLFADERVKGYIKVSPTMLRTKNYQHLFALEAIGDSMNRARVADTPINNGDYVIVDHSRTTPKNGEYVVIVDNEHANIKRLFFDYDNEQIVLLSESQENYEPIFIDPKNKWDSLINGTVVQVVKKPVTA